LFDFLSPAEIQHLIHAYGLWTLFAVLMFESIGLPLPGETALVATALYAGSTHQFGIFPVIGVAASAAIVGDNIGYLLGRSVGRRLIMRYGRYVYLTETRLKLGQYLFQRHGGKIVFFGRFVAFLRTFAALLAGVNRMRWPHFLVMNALGGIVWASLFGGGAYLFDEEISVFAGPMRLLVLAFALALTVAGAVYFRRHEAELVRRVIAAHPDK
jgi:membrane protein DedA with SNARE-associated domain